MAPEDETAKTAFEAQRSRSALVAGRTLMRMAAEGPTRREDAQRSQHEAVERVQQGLHEAILQERVPSGYHEAIRRYFASLGERSK